MGTIRSVALYHSSYLQSVLSAFLTRSVLVVWVVNPERINLVEVPTGGFAAVLCHVFVSVSLISVMLILSVLPIA